MTHRGPRLLLLVFLLSCMTTGANDMWNVWHSACYDDGGHISSCKYLCNSTEARSFNYAWARAVDRASSG